VSDAPLLQVRGLRTWFAIRAGVFQRVVGWVRAVDGVDLSVPAGQTLALVGESGCGKTTVGRSILRLLPVQEGSIRFDGTELLELSAREMHAFRKQIQIVFQDPLSALDPRMRVRDAIAEGISAFEPHLSSEAKTERVTQLMRRVRLDPEHMWRYPHEFSGGQRQRICIARALAVEPRFLVCDESVSALDVSIQAQILNLLRAIQRELGLTYLFITHDLGVVRYLADRVAVMYLGEIVEEGPTEAIFAAPRHPYTQALLAAIPSLDPERRGVEVRALGDVPSPADPPPGCRFHTRCPHRMPRCSQERPGPYPRTEAPCPEDRRESPPAAATDGYVRCFLLDTGSPCADPTVA